jgi:hypothetical protein
MLGMEPYMVHWLDSVIDLRPDTSSMVYKIEPYLTLVGDVQGRFVCVIIQLIGELVNLTTKIITLLEVTAHAFGNRWG